MKIKFLSAAFIVLVSLMATTFAADDDESDRIKVEIRGTLETGRMAIGAETTGTVIRANDVTWELDFEGNKEFQELATKLHKKKVLVTGNYEKRKGVEIRERHIVKVATLKSAEKIETARENQ